MVHVIFDPSSSSLHHQRGGEFYIGKVFQRGRGGRQGGEGIGDVFRNIWRYLKPLAVGAAKVVGQEGAEAGSKILSNLAQGADLKETLETQGKEGVSRILSKASKRLSKQQQHGAGLGKKSKKRHPHFNTPQVILKPEQLIGKKVPKSKALQNRPRSNTLGFY